MGGVAVHRVAVDGDLEGDSGREGARKAGDRRLRCIFGDRLENWRGDGWEVGFCCLEAWLVWLCSKVRCGR